MSSYPLLDVFLTMLWFFFWLLWLFLVVWIIMDVLRNRDLGGWAKAGWILLIVVPGPPAPHSSSPSSPICTTAA